MRTLTFLLCAAGTLAYSLPALCGTSRPANLWWSAVDQFDSANVTGSMSAAVRKPGKAGEQAMPAVFLHPEGRGLAEAAYPPITAKLAAGDRLFLLGHVGIADGFRWDDEEHKPDGVRFYVSVGGEQVRAIQLQESRWAPFACELAAPPTEPQEARTQVTLATDSGPANNSSYDWAMFGDPLAVSVAGTPLPAGEAVNGASGVLIARVTGGAGEILVEGLDAAGQPVKDAVARQAVAEGDETAFILFNLESHENCVQWRWRAEGVQTEAAWGGSWQPQMALSHVGPSRAVNFQGEQLSMRVAVTNTGRGALLPEHDARVTLGAASQPLPRLPAGQTATVEFEIAPRTGERLLAGVTAGGRNVATADAPSVPLWPPLPELPAGVPQGAEVRDLGAGYLLVQNRLSRWIVNTQLPGLGALVQVRVGDAWEAAGSVAPVAEIIRPDGSAEHPMFANLQQARAGGGITLTAQASCAGGLVCDLTASMDGTGAGMSVNLALRATADTQVLAVRGPAVHAGDRGTGSNKGIAVFPGLEYLYDDERSSSERDLAPPLHKRWAPHKFKVTVPMMLVETRDGGPVMGIAWDPEQKWDGEQIAPAAMFASPDFLTHQDNHLMQLALPPIPDGIPESELRAADPITLKAGETWRLEQHLFAAKPEPDLTAAYEWFDEIIGYPEPEAWPRSFEDEIALCRHGFMTTVWDEEKQKSRHCVGWGSANSPGMAALLLLDARTVAQAETKQQVLDRVNLIGNQTVEQEGQQGLASRAGCHIMAWEFPYHWGHVEGALAGMRAQAHNAINSQEENGGWGYYPDKDRSMLGEPGTQTSGICGGNAYIIAKYAAISGDPVALEAMGRALERIREFNAPRGAQGWECPILQPDVLASAYCVRAFVWAYMATGDASYLEDAKFWARTGLPFQYTWDDGERPGMRYASIPVFGSTFYTHTWIGLPVQWCGLVYAYGLVELMRFDENPLWKLQVEGMTASGVHQQWPMDNAELAGSYPDSYGAWFTRRNGAYINPEDIVLNVLALEGRDPGLRSMALPSEGGSIHLTAPGDLSAKLQDSALTATVSYIPNEVVYLTLAPVATPEGGITAAGETLQRRAELGPGATGWTFNEQIGALVVGLQCDAQGKATLNATGIMRQLPAQPREAAGWEFDEGAEGWQASHSCNVVGRDGSLVITANDRDPYCLSGPAGIDARKLKSLRARVRLSAGSAVGLFWRTTASPDWGPDKETKVNVPGDGQWHEVVFDLSAHALWKSKVVQLRFDIEPPDLPEGATLEVDWVRAE